MSTICTSKLTMKRSTKGAVLYENTKDGQAVTNLYLRKDGLAQPYPGEITVMITRHDDED